MKFASTISWRPSKPIFSMKKLEKRDMYNIWRLQGRLKKSVANINSCLWLSERFSEKLPLHQLSVVSTDRSFVMQQRNPVHINSYTFTMIR